MLSEKLSVSEMIDRGIPRQDYEVLDENNNVIGHVCSDTRPSVKTDRNCFNKNEYAKVGRNYIKIREKALKAITVKMPFIKDNHYLLG